MGSPWSPATPGAKYCGALIPPEAVSMGSPGMEIGAPGRPGLASSTWSWMMMLCAGSGVRDDGSEATTVTACMDEAICWNCMSVFVGWPAATETLETTVRNDVASAVNWYWPESTPSSVKFPCASLLPWRITLPAALVRVTCAPATVAPFGSSTLPVIRLVSVAERLEQASKSRLSTHAATWPDGRRADLAGCIQYLRGDSACNPRTGSHESPDL